MSFLSLLCRLLFCIVLHSWPRVKKFSIEQSSFCVLNDQASFLLQLLHYRAVYLWVRTCSHLESFPCLMFCAVHITSQPCSSCAAAAPALAPVLLMKEPSASDLLVMSRLTIYVKVWRRR